MIPDESALHNDSRRRTGALTPTIEALLFDFGGTLERGQWTEEGALRAAGVLLADVRKLGARILPHIGDAGDMFEAIVAGQGSQPADPAIDGDTERLSPHRRFEVPAAVGQVHHEQPHAVRLPAEVNDEFEEVDLRFFAGTMHQRDAARRDGWLLGNVGLICIRLKVKPVS